MSDVKIRARNTMIGLAIGDAISWSSMFHRSFLLPPWTRRIRREIDAASETTNVIVTPMPFSLNQPAEHLDLSPTSNTEWASFAAKILMKNGLHSYAETVRSEWTTLAQSKIQIRGGVSTQAALNNFRTGLQPPQTGKENPHYFDDGALSRAVPIGIICAGQPEIAARLAEIDASVTNSEDGIWGAQAIAVAASLLCSGRTMDDSITEGIRFLPESSWIKRMVDDAIRISAKSDSIFTVLPELHSSIANREYSYGNGAPETLALAFAIALTHGNDFERALSVALTFPKNTESLPAIVGALAGGVQTVPFVSESWLDSIGTLKGICLPEFAGENYHALVKSLSEIAGKKVEL